VLIAANIIAAFALLWEPELALKYGFDPARPTAVAAFTSLFLHQNLLHLLGNMVFLAAVGPAVEVAAGSLRFTVVYLLGGLAGVAAHWAMTIHEPAPVPLIGASGCISACIGYYSLRYLHLRVTLAPKLSVPVLAIVALWLALQLSGAFVSIGGPAGGTAYWAHLGGFALGLVLGFTFRAPALAHKEAAYEAVREMDSRSPGAKLAAADLLLQHHPDDMGALREKADALSMLNEPDAEADVLIRMLELTPEPDQGPIVVRLDQINRLERLPSLRRTLLAEKLKGVEPDVARRLLVSVIRVMTDRERPDALYAMAMLDLAEYPELARKWLDELMSTYPLHPAADLARARGIQP
jgi:membrane associated rhomboid family serine protease